MDQNVNKIDSVLLLAYFFSEKDGVGSLRSRTLYNFLNTKNVHCDVLSRDNFSFTWFEILKVIMRSRHDIIYLSCGPFNSLIFVSIFSLFFKKKLVVDFRDAWSLNIATNYGKNNIKKLINIKLIISQLIEKFSYKVCYRFFVCTQGMYDEYTSLFGESNKILILENGYDFEPKLNVNNKQKKTSQVKFVCIGKFVEYDKEKAVSILNEIKNNKIIPDFTFYGSDEAMNRPVIYDVIGECNLSFIKRIPYDEVVKNLSNFDVGLLIIRDENIDYGTKIFDYIGAGIPFYSYLDKNMNFYNQFNRYIYNISEKSFYFTNEDVFLHARNSKYEKLKGVLY